MTNPATSFGSRLREMRTERKISLGMLAIDVGYSKGYLSKVENGQSKPSSDLAKRCDTQFGTTVFTKLLKQEIQQERAERKRLASASADRPVGELFERFYREHVAMLHTYVRGQGVASDGALVIVQDTMLECFQRWQMIENPGAWVRAVARNKIREHWRREIRRRDELGQDSSPTAAEESTTPSPSAETMVLSDSTLIALCRRLPLQQRAVVVKMLTGMDLAEIAAELQISEAGVRSNLRKARHTLRVAVGRDAVLSHRDVGDLVGEGQACEHLAVSLLRAQRITEATDSWRRAADAYGEAGLYINAGKALIDLGTALASTGKYEDATRIFDQAIAVFGRVLPPERDVTIPRQRHSGRCTAHPGQPLAFPELTALLTIFDCVASGVGATLIQAALAFRKHGDALRAHDCPRADDAYRAAQALFDKAGSPQPVAEDSG